jgi:hypothetical protein
MICSMSIAPTPPTPTEPADPGRALALPQVQRLERLAEMAMEQAEAMHAEAMDPVPPEPGSPADPAAIRARITEARAAFQRQARVVAQITAVQSRIARVLYGPQQAAPATPQAQTADQVRKQWRKRRVECIVQEAIAQCKPGNPYPLVDLRRRLEGLDPDLDPDFQDRPLGATVGLICRGLGLKPDWSQWAQEDWALAEARDRAPGSPYAGPAGAKPDTS